MSNLLKPDTNECFAEGPSRTLRSGIMFNPVQIGCLIALSKIKQCEADWLIIIAVI